MDVILFILCLLCAFFFIGCYVLAWIQDIKEDEAKEKKEPTEAELKKGGRSHEA